MNRTLNVIIAEEEEEECDDDEDNEVGGDMFIQFK